LAQDELYRICQPATLGKLDPLCSSPLPGITALASVALVISVETLQLVVQPFIWDEGMTREGYLVAPHVGAICWIGSMLFIAFASHRLTASNAQISD
jgi:hypothetical protein